jgi:hypothetical protein
MLMVLAICSFLCCCQKQKNSSSLAIPMADRIDSLSTDYSNYVLNMILIVNFNYLGYWPSSSIKMKCHSLVFNSTLQKVLCTILLITTNEVILWSPLDSWTVFNWIWSYRQPISSFSIDICSAKTYNLLA